MWHINAGPLRWCNYSHHLWEHCLTNLQVPHRDRCCAHISMQTHTDITVKVSDEWIEWSWGITALCVTKSPKEHCFNCKGPKQKSRDNDSELHVITYEFRQLSATDKPPARHRKIVLSAWVGCKCNIYCNNTAHLLSNYHTFINRCRDAHHCRGDIIAAIILNIINKHVHK